MEEGVGLRERPFPPGRDTEACSLEIREDSGRSPGHAGRCPNPRRKRTWLVFKAPQDGQGKTRGSDGGGRPRKKGRAPRLRRRPGGRAPSAFPPLRAQPGPTTHPSEAAAAASSCSAAPASARRRFRPPQAGLEALHAAAAEAGADSGRRAPPPGRLARPPRPSARPANRRAAGRPPPASGGSALPRGGGTSSAFLFGLGGHAPSPARGEAPPPGRPSRGSGAGGGHVAWRR